MSLHHIFFGSHLEEGETILFAAHKHWIFVFKDALRFLFFGIVIPWVLWIMIPELLLLSLLIFVVSFVIGVLDFCDWYFDVWLVTDVSIIDIDWVNLFVRRSSRIDYETIEGVSYEITGFWGYLMQFGNIQVDKASGSNAVLLIGAANPKRIELEILRHRNEYIENKTKDDEDNLKNILTSMIRRHMKHSEHIE